MTAVRTSIHASANGDCWFLCHGSDPADAFVFHEPNGPSGGTPSRIGIADFLATDAGAPERIALLRMIGTLVEAGHAAPPGREPGPEPGAAAAEPTPGEAVPSR